MNNQNNKFDELMTARFSCDLDWAFAYQTTFDHFAHALVSYLLHTEQSAGGAAFVVSEVYDKLDKSVRLNNTIYDVQEIVDIFMETEKKGVPSCANCKGCS